VACLPFLLPIPNHLLKGLKKSQVSFHLKGGSGGLWVLLEGCEVVSVLVVSPDIPLSVSGGSLSHCTGVSKRSCPGGQHLLVVKGVEKPGDN